MRKSYGFRTFRALELALYHSLGKLPEPDRPTISSDESKMDSSNTNGRPFHASDIGKYR